MKPSHLTVKERYLLNLWNDYLQSGKLHQLDRFLAQALRQIKNAGKRDRLWYGDHLFAMSRFSWLALFIESLPRQQRPDEHLLKEHLQHWQPPISIAAGQQALQKLSAAALWQTTQQRLGFLRDSSEDNRQHHHQDSPSNATSEWLNLLSQLAQREDCLSARLLWAGISPHWQSHIKTRAAHDHWASPTLHLFIEAHTSRPPLYVRPQPNQLQQVSDDFQQNNLQIQRMGSALAVSGSKGLYELESYKNGLFEIQDLASQSIGEHVAPHAGDLGWDACAGGGGKSLQLASMMQGKGAVYASDIREHKLDEIRRRAQRAQLHNIRTFAWQGEPLDRLPAAVQKRGGFDWVLVDAPCTSSGTWRRNPDARWRCDEQTIHDITALQSKLLRAAAPSVRPGGKLVYSTCSFFVEENESIVASFLQQHPEFSLQSQGLHGSPHADADTMFSALLIRNAKSSLTNASTPTAPTA